MIVIELDFEDYTKEMARAIRSHMVLGMRQVMEFHRGDVVKRLSKPRTGPMPGFKWKQRAQKRTGFRPALRGIRRKAKYKDRLSGLPSPPQVLSVASGDARRSFVSRASVRIANTQDGVMTGTDVKIRGGQRSDEHWELYGGLGTNLDYLRIWEERGVLIREGRYKKTVSHPEYQSFNRPWLIPSFEENVDRDRAIFERELAMATSKAQIAGVNPMKKRAASKSSVRIAG